MATSQLTKNNPESSIQDNELLILTYRSSQYAHCEISAPPL